MGGWGPLAEVVYFWKIWLWEKRSFVAITSKNLLWRAMLKRPAKHRPDGRMGSISASGVNGPEVGEFLIRYDSI